jgi:gas vesicle protein
MEENQKKSKFGLGLIIGSIVGAITAFFFSPKSGPENRKMVAKKIKELEKLLKEKEVDKKVKEIFNEVTEESKKIYLQAKQWLIEELAALKKAIDEIDKEEYLKAVNTTVKKVEKEFKKSRET